MRIQIILFLAALFIFFMGNAQTDSIPTVRLDEINIKSSRIPASKLRLPMAISIKDFSDEQDVNQQLSIDEYLQFTPGLFIMNAHNFSQDARISIRGFGARSAFGIRGIKLLVDGIPETTPDGQGQIDNLNLGIIKKIEVIRGASSTMYGNASGGVISVLTNDTFTKNFVKSRILLGSYNLQQYQISAGIQSNRTKLLIQATNSETDGYRDHSAFKNKNLNIRFIQQFSPKSNLHLHFNYADSPFAFDAGGLTISEVENNRRQARTRNVEFQTKERIEQLKLSAAFEQQWNNSSFHSYAFYASREFEGFLPFEFGGVVDLNRDYYGIGSSFSIQSSTHNTNNKLQIGYDYANQRDHRNRFKNLQGTTGEATLNQMESFNAFGIYALNHWSKKRFLIRSGLRFDANTLKAEDHFLTNGDQSGKEQMNSVSPSLGINFDLKNQNALFTNFSTSFETPVLSELSANPNNDGGFNADLKPQRASNLEFGYKSQTKKHQSELVLYYISTKNDIVPFELEAFPDRTFFNNAGKTERKGIEFFHNISFSDHFSLNAMYTYSDFTYKKYETPGGDFKGKQLPGIPKHMGSVTGIFNNGKGLNIQINHNYSGDIYADNENSTEVKDYHVTNLKAGYQIRGKHLLVTPFIGIKNLFNSNYYDNVRINAFGKRYYEPAPGFNMYGGIRFELN